MAFASSPGSGALGAGVDCKPGSVPRRIAPNAARIIRLGDTLLCRSSAQTRAQPPRSGESGGPPSSAPLFELAPGGACRAAGRPAVARGLLPHDFTLACASSARPLSEPCGIAGHRRCPFCCAFPRVAPGRRWRPPCPVEPGLSSRGPRASASAGDPPSTSSRRQRSSPGGLPKRTAARLPRRRRSIASYGRGFAPIFPGGTSRCAQKEPPLPLGMDIAPVPA